MKHRTAVLTGRTAAMQLNGLTQTRGSFRDYAAMVERLSAGYFRSPPRRRLPVEKSVS